MYVCVSAGSIYHAVASPVDCFVTRAEPHKSQIYAQPYARHCRPRRPWKQKPSAMSFWKQCPPRTYAFDGNMTRRMKAPLIENGNVSHAAHGLRFLVCAARSNVAALVIAAVFVIGSFVTSLFLARPGHIACSVPRWIGASTSAHLQAGRRGALRTWLMQMS